jgi:hypothetical protein
MMEYLFIFGYENPAEAKANAESETDFESSMAVRIVAPNEAEALAWGNEIAEWFVATLYRDATVSWKKGGFAAWVETEPDDHMRQRWTKIPVVRVGEYPAMDKLLSEGNTK